MKRNTILVFARNIFLMIIGFIISILIARSLGPEIQGQYAIYILIPSILFNLGNLGIGSSAIYLINNDLNKKYSYLLFIKKIVIVLAIVNMIIGGVIGYFYLSYSGLSSSTTAFILMVLLIPLLLINNIMLFLFQALKDFKQFSFNSIFPKLLQLILLVIIIFTIGNSLEYSLFIFLTSNIIATIYSIYKLKTIINNMDKTVYEIEKKVVVTYGLKTHLANTITFLNYRVDQILIGYFLGAYSVGIYNIAILLVEKIWSLTNPIITVLFPELSGERNQTKIVNITTRLTRIVTLINVIIFILFIPLSNIIIGVSFGDAYLEATVITNILLVGILAMNIDKILSNIFASDGKPEINMRISNITLLSNILLAIILIPKYGLIGAAISTTLSYIITTFMKLHRFSFNYKVSFRNILIINKEDINYIKKIIKR